MINCTGIFYVGILSIIQDIKDFKETKTKRSEFNSVASRSWIDEAVAALEVVAEVVTPELSTLKKINNKILNIQ